MIHRLISMIEIKRDKNYNIEIKDALFKELVDSPQKRTEKTEEVSMIYL